jgi:hypothetical protein
MPFNCPVAPANPDPSLVLQTTTVLAGTELVRFYSKSKKYPADSFNPNTGKRIGVEEDGARFNPFPGAPAPNVPTMYAADTLPAAALESVFHNVDHSPSPSFPKMQLADWHYSRLKVMRTLLVVELTNPHLRQLTVPGRATSIEEGELIHSPTSEYPTREVGHDSFTRACLRSTVWPGDRGLLARDGPMCSLETVSRPKILKSNQLRPTWTQVRDTLRSSKLPSRLASGSSDPNKPYEIPRVFIRDCLDMYERTATDEVCAATELQSDPRTRPAASVVNLVSYHLQIGIQLHSPYATQ